MGMINNYLLNNLPCLFMYFNLKKSKCS